MPAVAKRRLTFMVKPNESIVREIFKGEMSIKTLSTTFLQTSCKIIPKSQLSVKSIIDPDDKFQRNS